MIPVVECRVSPVGKLPTVTVHEPYGGVPPVALKVTLYAVLIVAVGNGVGVTICKGTTAGLMVSENVLLAVCGVEQESVTLNCGLNAPETDGVPETIPVPARLTPVGSVPPICDHVSAPVPPVDVNCVLYGEFCVPVGNVRLPEIAKGTQEIVMENVPGVVWPALSATWIENVEVPIVVGVPEIRPAALMTRPAGKVPEINDHV